MIPLSARRSGLGDVITSSPIRSGQKRNMSIEIRTKYRVRPGDPEIKTALQDAANKHNVAMCAVAVCEYGNAAAPCVPNANVLYFVSLDHFRALDRPIWPDLPPAYSVPYEKCFAP